MSRGMQKRCPLTEVPLARLDRVSEECLTDEGYVDVAERFPDSNLFCVRSIAAVGGFRDTAYFRDVMLSNPDCPIHVHRLVLKDELTGQSAAEVYATHQNSAHYGGQMWHKLQREAARSRATQCNSLQAG